MEQNDTFKRQFYFCSPASSKSKIWLIQELIFEIMFFFLFVTNPALNFPLPLW